MAESVVGSESVENSLTGHYSNLSFVLVAVCSAYSGMAVTMKAMTLSVSLCSVGARWWLEAFGLFPYVIMLGLVVKNVLEERLYEATIKGL